MQFVKKIPLIIAVLMLGGFLLDVTGILCQEVIKTHPAEKAYDCFIPTVFVSQEKERILRRYPKMIIEDFTSAKGWRPRLSEMSRKQFIISAGTVTVYALLDEQIFDFLYDGKKNFTDRQLDRLTHITGNPLQLGLCGMVLGIIFQKERFADAGFTVMEGAVIADVIISPLKFLFGRARPLREQDNHFYRPLRKGYSSLPCRHTFNIFTAASIISEYYPGTKVFAYGAAGFVGFHRISSGAHWSTDVIVSALFGYFIGKKLARSHLRLYPIRFPMGGSGLGVVVPL